jgi:hypothetical protein
LLMHPTLRRSLTIPSSVLLCSCILICSQAASDKRIAELKAVLNEINGRKGGREMTIDEVRMLFLLCA